jgi:phosphate transport system substrate-binding protein
MLKNIAFVAVSALALTACQDQASSGGAGGSRQEIRIVGSSTVFPFAKAVGDAFKNANATNKTPVAESTGTGSGIKEFCKGVAADTPDIATASRRIKKSEFELCAKNGVTEIVEVQIGIDGIAMAESVTGLSMKLTPLDIYKALAANPFGKPQTAKTWKDVNPALPAAPIAAFGPPSTSGTRDAFNELIMEAGCKTDAATKALKESDEKKFKSICHDYRNDGGYQEQGENDNLIVQKLSKDPNMVGIFGYSYLAENAEKVRAIAINGVMPTVATIADGSYPGARPLYIYIKKAHVGKVPGIKEYVAEFVKAGAEGGTLSKLGMIASSADIRVKAEATAADFANMDSSGLK